MPPTVQELLALYPPGFTVHEPGRVVTDTTEFHNITSGDVIAAGGQHYLVIRDEAERRFGIEDPKFWVKRCICLENRESKILKLVFHESFPMQIGDMEVACYRSPDKESRILDLVQGDWRFMQGFTVRDEAGNNVRVLEMIRGRRLDLVVDAIEADHRSYVREHLPGLLEQYLGSCEAIGLLHAHGEKHGDIRRDHIWHEYGTGRYRWIDFDYTFDYVENPFGLDLFGLGNILLFLVGKGIRSAQNLSPEESALLDPGDYSLMYGYRVMNVRKLYPYLPRALNDVLMHYAVSSEVYYETVDELLDDLRPCLDLLPKC